MKIKVGVIGCGRMAQRIHLKTLADLEEAELFAVCDINQELAKTVGAKYKVAKIFFDHNELLAEKEVDCVIICTPPTDHLEIAVNAARAGKHVFIEKPLARTVEECETIIEECRRDDVKLMVGLMRRFDKALMWTKKQIEAGSVGEIFVLNSFYYHTSTYPNYLSKTDSDLVKTTYALKSAKEDFSAFLANHMIHHADLLRWFGGSIAEVLALGERGSWFNISAIFKFVNSSIGFLQFAGPIRKEWEETLVAHGTRGSALVSMPFPYLNSPSNAVIASDEAGLKSSPLTIVNTMYEDEIRHFLHSIMHEEEPTPTGLEALEAQKLISAIEHSLNTKSRVAVE